MCIRDRRAAAGSHRRAHGDAVIAVGVDASARKRGLPCDDESIRQLADPVSYTHLDVYKRQGSGRPSRNTGTAADEI